MNRETAKKLLPIIMAFANGAAIQSRANKREAWYLNENPGWLDNVEYRIKPDTIKSRRYVYEAPMSGQKRVGIMYEGAWCSWPMTSLKPDDENIKRIEEMATFIGWIDNDWVESEIPNKKTESGNAS